MTLEVLLFASARALVGKSSVMVTLPDVACAKDLIGALASEHHELRPLLPSCRLAVDEEYVTEDFRLRSGCQCALIPPVSGG